MIFYQILLVKNKKPWYLVIKLFFRMVFLIIFLLSLFLFDCFASNDLVAMSHVDAFGMVRTYFFQNPTGDDLQCLNEKQMAKVENFKFSSVRKYSVRFAKAKEEAKASSEIARFFYDVIRLYGSEFDLLKRLKLILNRNNFADGDQTTVVLQDELIGKMSASDLLDLCFDKQYIRITTAEPSWCQTTDWQPEVLEKYFDEGVGRYIIDMNLKLSGVLVSHFINQIEKYDYSDLAWYEKILNRLDNRYLYTKRFYGKKAPWITVRHSRSFRKNFLRFVVASLVMIGLIAIALKAARFRFIEK
jgi:hypothetical protein